jgi:hypothetical protein
VPAGVPSLSFREQDNGRNPEKKTLQQRGGHEPYSGVWIKSDGHPGGNEGAEEKGDDGHYAQHRLERLPRSAWDHVLCSVTAFS